MPNAKPELLVVDDALSVRMSLLSMLTALHYAVRVAPDGFTALTEIRQEVPDLILSELNMPGMSGGELLSVVRRRFPSIRAIAMSSALSGWGVPSGVAADAFYPKKAHPGLLLQIMEDITYPRKSMLTLRTRPLAPVWMSTHTVSEQSYVTVTYPKYLRTFSQVVDNRAGSPAAADCVGCRSPIHLCDCPLISPSTESHVGAKVAAAAEQLGNNSRDAVTTAECQPAPEENRDTVN